jgi:hypothetical protein
VIAHVRPHSTSDSEQLLHSLQAQPCAHTAAVYISDGENPPESLEASRTANISPNQACIHSFHAFPSADQVHWSRNFRAALHPALSWDLLHYMKSPASCMYASLCNQP